MQWNAGDETPKTRTCDLTLCTPDAMECRTKLGKAGEPAESAGNDACETPEERAAAIKTPARRTDGARADRRSGSDFMSERHERPAESRQPFRRAGASATNPAEEACGGTALKTPEEGGADGRHAAYGRRAAAEKPFRRKKLCSSQKASFTTGVFAAGISLRRHRDTNASCRKQAIGMQPAKGTQQQSTRLGVKAAGMQPAGSRKIRRRATDRRLHQTDGFTTCGSPARHRRCRQPPTSDGQRSAPSTIRMSSCCVWTSSLR